MRSALLALSIVLGMIFSPPSLAHYNAPHSEIHVRESVIKGVSQLWLAGSLEHLDLIYEHYTTTKARTPSGTWLLTWFYAGLMVAEGGKAAETEDQFQARLALYRERVTASPGKRYLHIAYAKVLSGKAWWHRGGGYAREVKKENWAPFHEYIQEAHNVLVRSRGLASGDPEWYATMMSISSDLGNPPTTILALVDEAARREPAYLNTYFEASYRLLPKWGGSYAMLETLATNAVLKTQDTEGLSLFARIHWYLSDNEEELTRHFTQTERLWTRMKAGMRDVLKRYPNTHNTDAFLQFACKAKDADFVDWLWGEKAKQMVGPTGLIGPKRTIDPAKYCRW